MIAVVDYGSQYTQLIAKKLRRLGFASEVFPSFTKAADLKNKNISGLILSGSPSSVGENIHPDPAFLDLGLPILGLCFGYHFLAQHLGGKLGFGESREYGAALVDVTPAAKKDQLLAGVPDQFRVWMSHGDSVKELPPGAEILLSSKGKIAAFSLPKQKVWALQFHPEVHHSEQGELLFKNFAEKLCGLTSDWNLKDVLANLKQKLKAELSGVSEVMCAVSGGVDSTVMAVLLAEFTQVNAVFVDHGFQRAYDLKDLKETFAPYPQIHLSVLDARDRFWKELKGVSDPEEKRKLIGKMFIEAFDDFTVRSDSRTLAQGTIYSDVIESAGNENTAAHKIKSHHNVGGMPKDIPFRLIEPLRNFFKDEVREIGKLLGIRREALARHPFPGPGLAIRCLGELHPERIEILRKSDEIFHDELVKRGLYEKVWQAGAILLPISTVGVMGDGRTYESVLALRAVSSLDAMTAEASDLPLADLKAIASRLVNEVKGVNRVVFDLSSKPPATIEWE